MRDIKFRVWNEGAVFSLSEAIFNEFIVIQHNREECFEIEKVYDDIVIEQFTGLLDKNGVEIYEGDIVFIHGYGEYLCEFPFLELYDAVMENDIGNVIGNIHQNPEFLK